MSKQTEIVKSQETMPTASQQPTVAAAQVLPAVDVYESDDEIMIVADMPGVQPESVDVELEGRELTMIGTQAVLDSADAPREYRRAFTVPPSIASDRVGAEYKAGVLYVKLGKSEQAKPKRIQIRSA